jgi:hypothetical protein
LDPFVNTTAQHPLHVNITLAHWRHPHELLWRKHIICGEIITLDGVYLELMLCE